MPVNQHWTDRLSEYLDGDLLPADRAACEAHLAECDNCRGLLGELQSVIAAARTDRDRQPDADLWPAILARLDRPTARGAEVREFSDRAAVRKAPARVSFSLPQLALAASLLIAVSGGVSYLAATRTANRPAPQEPAIQAMAEPLMPPSAEVAPANFADAQFDQAVADLENVLTERRDELDPREGERDVRNGEQPRQDRGDEHDRCGQPTPGEEDGGRVVNGGAERDWGNGADRGRHSGADRAVRSGGRRDRARHRTRRRCRAAARGPYHASCASSRSDRYGRLRAASRSARSR